MCRLVDGGFTWASCTFLDVSAERPTVDDSTVDVDEFSIHHLSTFEARRRNLINLPHLAFHAHSSPRTRLLHRFTIP